MHRETGAPLVIGHRGAAGEAPENTLASFELALRQGADGLELDIHMSADGEIVVCHDATVDRTTNGSGAIAALSWERLRRLDAGSYYAERFAGERLPLLAEVLQLTPPGKLLNIEIKCAATSQLVARLPELLRASARMEDVVISSFDHKALMALHGAEPQLRLGLLYSANLVHHWQLAATSDMPVYSLHPAYRLIGAEDVAEAGRHGLAVFPYTINAPEDMLAAASAGVSGIITDYPARLRALFPGKGNKTGESFR